MNGMELKSDARLTDRQDTIDKALDELEQDLCAVGAATAFGDEIQAEIEELEDEMAQIEAELDRRQSARCELGSARSIAAARAR